MRIEGAIFDLDGTLLDSMFIWDTIGGDYLRSRGIEPREDLNRLFKSMSLLQAVRYYQSEYGLPESEEELIAGVNGRIERLYRDVVQPKAGAAALLAELRRRDVKMCVATATDRYMVEAALGRCGLLDFFSGVFTCGEVGSGKDSPDIFEAALKFLGTPKAATPVFEDALHAVRTAKAAGFPVVAVFDASESAREEEVRRAADIYIRSYDEMREYID